MKKETWSIWGIITGLILVGLSTLFSSLGWLNFWIISSAGIPLSIISIGFLLFLMLKKKNIMQLKEESIIMTTFDEGRKIIEKDADDPKHAVKIIQDKHYEEGDLSIGEGGSTQAHYVKTKVEGEGLFYHEFIDKEPMKDNKGNPIKDKNENYSYRKSIKYTVLDPDEDPDAKKSVDEWIRKFATRPTRKIITKEPIVTPMGTVLGYKEEEKELAEIEEKEEEEKEKKEGEA